MTSQDILKKLLERHSKALCFPELKMGTGFRLDATRSIDLFVMEDIPSKHFVRTAYEIKVSSSDVSRELANPVKRRPSVRFANQFFFITPVGLIKPNRVPEDCGLLEMADDGWIKTVVPAPWFDNAPNWSFVASLARRLKEMETK